MLFRSRNDWRSFRPPGAVGSAGQMSWANRGTARKLDYHGAVVKLLLRTLTSTAGSSRFRGWPPGAPDACERFTWDPKKAASNLKKHGVSLVEAASVFADPLAAMLDDELDPERAILVGHAETGRVLLVVFIELSDETIRII